MDLGAEVLHYSHIKPPCSGPEARLQDDRHCQLECTACMCYWVGAHLYILVFDAFDCMSLELLLVHWVLPSCC